VRVPQILAALSRLLRLRHSLRVVAAPNRDLERMVEDGSFRSDLYYRLNVLPIHVPPLRERVADIPALAAHFSETCARRLGRQAPVIPPGVMAALKRWSWPGNVRELENVIERAVIMSTGPDLHIRLQDLQASTARGESGPTPSTYREAERDVILRALRDSGGVVAGASAAAARLGLTRTTLQGKMRRLGIRRPSF
jgi:formate hydrogenlyase transcriptional activator